MAIFIVYPILRSFRRGKPIQNNPTAVFPHGDRSGHWWQFRIPPLPWGPRWQRICGITLDSIGESQSRATGNVLNPRLQMSQFLNENLKQITAHIKCQDARSEPAGSSSQVYTS